jgi:hypothetical protein
MSSLVSQMESASAYEDAFKEMLNILAAYSKQLSRYNGETRSILFLDKLKMAIFIGKAAANGSLADRTRNITKTKKPEGESDDIFGERKEKLIEIERSNHKTLIESIDLVMDEMVRLENYVLGLTESHQKLDEVSMEPDFPSGKEMMEKSVQAFTEKAGRETEEKKIQ